ncbi:MAG: hypothetical protein QW815_01800 [Nitrososphaerota archaeon]
MSQLPEPPSINLINAVQNKTLLLDSLVKKSDLSSLPSYYMFFDVCRYDRWFSPGGWDNLSAEWIDWYGNPNKSPHTFMAIHFHNRRVMGGYKGDGKSPNVMWSKYPLYLTGSPFVLYSRENLSGKTAIVWTGVGEIQNLTQCFPHMLVVPDAAGASQNSTVMVSPPWGGGVFWTSLLPRNIEGELWYPYVITSPNQTVYGLWIEKEEATFTAPLIYESFQA